MFFGFSLVVVPCVLFVCLPFLLWFVFDGTAHWTVYWSITSAFEAIDVQTALHDNLQFIFLLRLNVCNDLAKAMKALDGKKQMLVRMMTRMLRICSNRAKRPIQESGPRQRLHNTCQLPWHAFLMRKRSAITMWGAALFRQYWLHC